MAVRSVSILGATGSVGRSTLDVIASAPDRFAVQAVTAQRNVAALAALAKAHRARHAVIGDETLFHELKDALAGTDITVAAGRAAIIEAASMEADIVMAAIVGMAGLEPVMAALRQGRCVAIANKEPLVAAGPLVMAAAKEYGATILPVDSEHNAIFQVFEERNRAQISRLVLTASGGPFRTWTKADMDKASPAQAVAHPNWSMGAKISVDSASMMNKALEVIEAHYLFNMPPEQIEVLVHPQSIIHSMVEYEDGSFLAQLGAPDMRTPIAYALAWPERMATPGMRLDWRKMATLEFEALDGDRFPAVGMAYDALRAGAGACLALNAANEVAVAAFLDGQISFGAINEINEEIMAAMPADAPADLPAIIARDGEARARAEVLLDKREKSAGKLGGGL